jgi:hypothetical protein
LQRLLCAFVEQLRQPTGFQCAPAIVQLSVQGRQAVLVNLSLRPAEIGEGGPTACRR